MSKENLCVASLVFVSEREIVNLQVQGIPELEYDLYRPEPQTVNCCVNSFKLKLVRTVRD